MDDKEQKRAAEKFVEFWQGKGYEKGQTQAFWLSLLREVFGVKEPERERQKFCVHGIIGARQTGASNEHEHQTQFS